MEVSDEIIWKKKTYQDSLWRVFVIFVIIITVQGNERYFMRQRHWEGCTQVMRSPFQRAVMSFGECRRVSNLGKLRNVENGGPPRRLSSYTECDCMLFMWNMCVCLAYQSPRGGGTVWLLIGGYDCAWWGHRVAGTRQPRSPAGSDTH